MTDPITSVPGVTPSNRPAPDPISDMAGLAALRFGVALSSASEMVDGPDLMRESMTRETLAEAQQLRDDLEAAQPGILGAVTVRTADGWKTLVTGTTIRDWLENLQ